MPLHPYATAGPKSKARFPSAYPTHAPYTITVPQNHPKVLGRLLFHTSMSARLLVLPYLALPHHRDPTFGRRCRVSDQSLAYYAPSRGVPADPTSHLMPSSRPLSRWAPSRQRPRHVMSGERATPSTRGASGQTTPSRSGIGMWYPDMPTARSSAVVDKSEVFEAVVV